MTNAWAYANDQTLLIFVIFGLAWVSLLWLFLQEKPSADDAPGDPPGDQSS